MTIHPIIAQMEQAPERLQSHWCLPQEEARFLYLLACIGSCRRILEVGTSIGYSTLHLAQAASRTNGHVTTIDASADRQAEALTNLKSAQLDGRVTFIHGDALKALSALFVDGQTFDLMFIDARKSQYVEYLEWAEKLLPSGGILLADNTRSHRHSMLDFIERIHQSAHWEVSDLETPSGLILAQKRP
ncbi:O-methyltransferase [Vampirovibrio sp.]|uniref:O-methyltransferase n=1 Tax=Vampirovibrio sp. TaxID=2717857 RepID=UPI00359377EE